MKVYEYYGENASPNKLKQNTGLYNPAWEHDACGVGFIADIQNRKSRDIIDSGIKIMKNLDHRGAIGADPKTGDGAGMTIQIPDVFFKRVTKEIGITLPEVGRYGIGVHFFPQNKVDRKAIQNIIEKIVVDEDLYFLGWRDVPVNSSILGEGALSKMPFISQSFIGANDSIKTPEDLERKLYMIRRSVDHRIRTELELDLNEYYVPSFSCKTIVYKGMLTGEQFADFFPDIMASDMVSALSMTHTRFATNTFPSWGLAHPFRLIAHNGEINTLRGNINWMAAREKVMTSDYFSNDLKRMLPILMNGQSDSAAFDCVLELLVMNGRSLPHAIMMMIPEAWSKNNAMESNLKAFYEYHATIMEPWDGPAAVIFTDGNMIGGTLDRNGLRPARYVITKDDRVILSSEVGVLDIASDNIKQYGKLQPGKMFLIDLIKKRIVPNEEIKEEVSSKQPYKKWVTENIIHIDALPESDFIDYTDHSTIIERLRCFNYTKEDINVVLKPMLTTGKEAVGSMGTDASLAILSDKPQVLFRYFKQLFAQVTNPPVDPIREELVFELTTYLGPEENLLTETDIHANRIELSHPVITNNQLSKISNINKGRFRSESLSTLFNIKERHSMREALYQLCQKAQKLASDNVGIIILSDRGVNNTMAAIPSLLAVAAVHHHLTRNGLRTLTSIILESAEPREVSHFALLCGYGANAINPYLAFETIDYLYKIGDLSEIKDEKIAYKNYFKSIEEGLFKVFSKMGISSLQSYCGAQIFEAIGLDSELIDNYFTGTASQIEGLSLEMLEDEVKKYHIDAYNTLNSQPKLTSGGLYNYRSDGEHHLWNPLTIAKLQISSRTNDFKTYKEYADLINNQEFKRVTLRSLLDFDYSKNAIDIKDVEPASEIVKRFVTGAMSFGSISWEAHTSLAIAMNKIGGKSNTGEGGEDPSRFKPINGVNMRSAIKQVASGRFGVTAEYLVNADELQIKMAQGAKPGEGGQLPGFKVDKIIGKIRHSTPGVTLISPPPHHDIYSIEDLKQLIFDLKNINPKARISVKLVSEVGVGTIAAGVAKAHADHILISGHDGGTGASPISSIQYAGTPWEIGLSEVHQTLVLNGLRDRVWVQTDGQLKTGRDVVIAALMGSDEFGFATAPLVTQGCIMMRKCHLNTCPVGVATQDPVLRKKFMGSPEYVINYMFFVAEEVREYMAKLGFKTFNEMIGQIDRLVQIKAPELKTNDILEKPSKKWKGRGIDLTNLLTKVEPKYKTNLYRTQAQYHALDAQLDNELIKQAKESIENKKATSIKTTIKNVNRTVGAMLSHEIATRYGHAGLPDATIKVQLTGFAGQSFGAFLARGIELTLIGASNDYIGKGLSGGRIIVKVSEGVSFDPSKNIIVGNTTFYGAIEGEAYLNGTAGERFCVRNSGANAVVEGVGDHGCEYMTGGTIVILGAIGRNFAAGMSGGIAYIWDCEKNARNNINMEMVNIDPMEEEDIQKIHAMISKHSEYTNSKIASYILNTFDKEKANFIKVISHEYKKALLALAEESIQTKKNTELKVHG